VYIRVKKVDPPAAPRGTAGPGAGTASTRPYTTTHTQHWQM